jgi:hypothetical protein
MTLADLPDPNTGRWVIRRKAEVIHAVHGGLLTKQEAMKKYRLTLDEYAEWESAYAKHGIKGLRVTRVGLYRALDRA